MSQFCLFWSLEFLPGPPQSASEYLACSPAPPRKQNNRLTSSATMQVATLDTPHTVFSENVGAMALGQPPV